VSGVDIDPEQIESARLATGALTGVGFLVCDATSLPFPSGQFKAGHASKATTKKYVHLAGIVFRDEAEAMTQRMLGRGNLQNFYRPDIT
jgi:hypothetical protein